MEGNLPGFYIVRLGPRKADGDDLRGSYIQPDVDIRNFDISENYRDFYDKTIWSKQLPPEVVVDFGQPPRLPNVYTTEQGLRTYDLKPDIGDFLILVHGSRNPSGDGNKARRGLISLAQVVDIHFYQNKRLDHSLKPKKVEQSVWTKSRCVLRAKVLTVAPKFLITPTEFKQSIYYTKSGLNEQEATLGIGSTSASGNIGPLFSGEDEDINEEKVVNLLSLFKQFIPSLDEDLKDTKIATLIPKSVDSLAFQQSVNQMEVGLDFNGLSHQKIYFGSPGSGKSRQVKIDTKGMAVFRTTFHPDSDYSSFVGVYKPTVSDGEIAYKYVPQVFAKAYLQAWQNLNVPVCLVIEEINRGNCAQIFGDLFQLLDRDDTGFSEYHLKADADFANYLADYLTDSANYTRFTGGLDELLLPNNLYLYATMNTSDQSLFPMDSAFKRRWDWEYVPIDYDDARQLIIKLSDDWQFNWGVFIEAVNREIVELTGSEDKQLGNRFVKPVDGIVSREAFRSKVMFYLWSEIYKHETSTDDRNIFRYQPANKPDTVPFTFNQLFTKMSDDYGNPIDADLIILPSFMRQLGIERLS
jgi:hypothetical protein